MCNCVCYTAGADFSPVIVTFTFDPDVVSFSHDIDIIDDDLMEPSESFMLFAFISSGSGSFSPSGNVSIVTIFDDDECKLVYIAK